MALEKDPAIGESAAEIIIHTLHHCLKDKKYLGSVFGSLGSEDLPDETELRWLYRQIAEVWTKHREPIPRLVLERRAARAKRGREEKAELISQLFDDEGEEYPKLALEELHKWLRTRRMHVALVRAVDIYDTDTDRAYELLKQTVVKDAAPPGIQIADWFQDFDDRQVEREESAADPLRVIPTGFRRIDEALAGGIARGELALILAPTARGKSMALTDLGYRAGSTGFQVTHLTLEMSLLQTATRYDARWSKVDSRRFKTFNFESEQLEVIEAKKRRASHLNGKVQIVHVPVNQCDGNTIRSIFSTLKEMGVPNTDLLLIDSGDHMRALRKFDAFRHETASVYWELKAIAQEYNCATVTTTHASKEWADKLIKAEGAAEAYDKSRIADIIISLNKSKEEGREDVRKHLDLYLAKYRDGEDKFKVPVSVKRPIMFFEEITEFDDGDHFEEEEEGEDELG